METEKSGRNGLDKRMTAAAALDAVRNSSDRRYAILRAHGSLEIGFYKPDKIDPQQPHDRDEVYVIQAGSGEFVCGDERQPFEAGEALFVPAGAIHRFETFTDDFAAWVIFYGPPGGEKAEDQA